MTQRFDAIEQYMYSLGNADWLLDDVLRLGLPAVTRAAKLNVVEFCVLFR